MEQDTQKALQSRFKSLMWRAGMMALAGVLSFVVNNIGELQLSPTMTTFIGLILGEVSKYINNMTSQKA